MLQVSLSEWQTTCRSLTRRNSLKTKAATWQKNINFQSPREGDKFWIFKNLATLFQGLSLMVRFSSSAQEYFKTLKPWRCFSISKQQGSLVLSLNDVRFGRFFVERQMTVQVLFRASSFFTLLFFVPRPYFSKTFISAAPAAHTEFATLPCNCKGCQTSWKHWK